MLCSSKINQTITPFKPNVTLHYKAVKGEFDTISRLFASLSVKIINYRWMMVVFLIWPIFLS